jgi:hypothetical protein
MLGTAEQSEMTFLSLPRELRQQILLEVFPKNERGHLVNRITSGAIEQQRSTRKQTIDDFWTIQERGWLVNSVCSTTFRGPKQQLEEQVDAEITSRLSTLEPVHKVVKEDMDYISLQWRASLDVSIKAWCVEFRSQHKQVRGAGPGANNWWWVPVSEDENWYQTLLDSQAT